MGLVSKSIPNLINGVSQQPASLRLESQGELQENGFSDVVDGLKKRPPTKFLKNLLKVDPYHPDNNPDGFDSPYHLLDEGHSTEMTASDLDGAFFHTYKLNNDEQYQVIITADKIVRAYDMEGNLRYESGRGSWEADGTLIETNADNTDYLPDNPKDITATSVADATFIVNKTKTVEMSDVVNPASNVHSALVYLKSVNYGRDYTVTVTSKTSGGAFTVSSGTPNQINNIESGDESNTDGLKVSDIIGKTPAGSTRTNLRDQIINQVGDPLTSLTLPEVRQEWDYVGSGNRALPSSYLDIPAPTYIDDDDNLQTYDLHAYVQGNTTDDLTLTVGGIHIEYDEDGTAGWKLDDNNTNIILPAYVARRESRIVNIRHRQQRWIRPKVVLQVYETYDVNNLTEGARGLVEPPLYNDEPYFVLTTTDQGNIKDFDIIVTDDDGGTNLKAFKDTAKSFTDLPNQCLEGFRLGVVGDNQKKEDDFHVVFKGGAGSGYWKETVGYNLHNYFDLSTMPHTLRQIEGGSFIFGVAEDNNAQTWWDRKAGDDNTNPAPSFVGQKITDIFFHRNRLGVLAGENVIFSEAGSYLNFWRTTVRTLLDSDPIDVSVSQNEVAELKAAVPIQDNLLLFSELNQFTLSATQLLTPAEVTIDQSTKYECDLTATPVGAGTSVFFATQGGEFSGVREFFTKTDTDIKDAPEVTSHIPKYIKGNITSIQASSNEDMLILLTDGDKNECYVYKWYNSSEERLQSSWSKWVFSKNITSVSFNNAKIFFTFEDGSYEVIDLAEVNDNILLDHKITNVFPTEVPDDYITDTMICVTEEGLNLGHYDNTDTNPETNPVLKYIQSGGTITFGEPYTFKYQLSEQVFKPDQQGATDLGRLQLRKINFNFSNTGQFKVDVESVGRAKSTSEFTGRILGQSSNLLDQSSIVPDGNFEVGIQSQAKTTKITIINDSYLPSVFQSAEWEGFITLRNQRL